LIQCKGRGQNTDDKEKMTEDRILKSEVEMRNADRKRNWMKMV